MTDILREVFNGRRVFVTGHTGFKGSWLCLWLSHLGARVTGYSLQPPSDPANFVDADVASRLVQHHVGDVVDLPHLEKSLRDADPEIVIHFAAQSVVREAHVYPRETFETNVMGTANVLEAIRNTAQPCTALLITSDKCYENVEQVWGYRENDALGDHDPYGASKGAAELVIRAYRDSFFPAGRVNDHGVKVTSARAGNVIGGGDWTKDALIVDIAKALIKDEQIRIRNPHAFRPWQHVLQALSGYLYLTAKTFLAPDGRFCDAWNIGPLPGNEIPVGQVVDKFIHYWGSGSWYTDSPEGQPHEATILRLNVEKAMWDLGWQPTWNVEQAIEKTAQWYQRYRTRAESGIRLDELCIEQICEFEQDFAAAIEQNNSSTGKDVPALSNS